MSKWLTDAELQEMERGIELHDPDADFLTARDGARLIAEVRRLRALFTDAEGDAQMLQQIGEEENWNAALDLAARLRQVKGEGAA